MPKVIITYAVNGAIHTPTMSPHLYPALDKIKDWQYDWKLPVVI